MSAHEMREALLSKAVRGEKKKNALYGLARAGPGENGPWSETVMSTIGALRRTLGLCRNLRA